MKNPLPINVENICEMTREGNTFYAENESLEIYAAGNSEHEAIEDFCQHVVYFYRHYEQLGWDQVMGRARKLKETYENLFQEARNGD